MESAQHLGKSALSQLFWFLNAGGQQPAAFWEKGLERDGKTLCSIWDQEQGAAKQRVRGGEGWGAGGRESRGGTEVRAGAEAWGAAPAQTEMERAHVYRCSVPQCSLVPAQ